jgi:glycosyltransferase involved in cell wall biosynthesis
MKSGNYVLITPARNEENYIERTIKSVIGQNNRPVRWVIVNDGSIDHTEDIVQRYQKEYDFIHLISLEKNDHRDFSSKVKAFGAGYDHLRDVEYDFIGNLDADVSFDSEYYERVLKEFRRNANLGIAGGIIFEQYGRRFVPQNISPDSVAGAVQLFRRESYEEIGGYIPLEHGGIDGVAEIMVRMKGWEVRTFPDLRVLHHRRVGTGNSSVLKTKFREGRRFYLLGYHPLFYALRTLVRFKDRPYGCGAVLQICGYAWYSFRCEKRPVSDDFIRYLRWEQILKLKSAFNGQRKKRF